MILPSNVVLLYSLTSHNPTNIFIRNWGQFCNYKSKATNVLRQSKKNFATSIWSYSVMLRVLVPEWERLVLSFEGIYAN